MRLSSVSVAHNNIKRERDIIIKIVSKSGNVFWGRQVEDTRSLNPVGPRLYIIRKKKNVAETGNYISTR